jgi:uncharacterized protein
MNEGEISRKLTETNLWWRDGDWEERDRDLRRLSDSPFSYTPHPLADIAPDGLYVLRGPRRVGKSVEVKRAIGELVRSGIAPRRILHFACDELNRGDLTRLVRAGRDVLTRGVNEPRYWFLDEITSVPGWPESVKNLRDTTAFGDDCVVLTGSSARDLDEATKQLADRRGAAAASDRVLLPMSFRAFCAALGMDGLPELPALAPRELCTPHAAELVDRLAPWLGELASAWELYLQVGGYPRAVSDQIRYGDVQPSFIDGLWDVIHGDALRAAGMEAAGAQALLVRLTKNLASPMNMTAVAEEIGVERNVTAQSRVTALVTSYLAWPCHKLGDHNLPNLAAQSKYYFTDSLLARIAHARLGQSPLADASAISEQQLGIALLRALECEYPGRFADFTSMTYVVPTRKEIDFVSPLFPNLGFEGKYVDERWRQESLTLKTRFGRGVFATRSVLDLSEAVWAIPAGMLVWLLND